jgi:hypothetical protein
MKSLERRIQRLESRLLPGPETEFDRVLRARMEEGRRRVAEARGESLPDAVRAEDSAADVPPPTYASAGHPRRSKQSELDRIVEILNRGRELTRLQSLQAEECAASSREKIPTQDDSQ